MLMVVRIKRHEETVREWIGQVARPSQLALIVAEQFEHLQQPEGTFLYPVTIQTDRYGAG